MELTQTDIQRIRDKVRGDKKQVVYAKALDKTDAEIREELDLSRQQFDRKREFLFLHTRSNSMNGVVYKCSKAGVI